MAEDNDNSRLSERAMAGSEREFTIRRARHELEEIHQKMHGEKSYRATIADVEMMRNNVARLLKILEAGR